MTTTIAIASGKGGVGKTTIAVNLSLSLALQNKDTLLFDADLGMANAHILLGINPELSLENFTSGKSKLDDVIYTTKEKLRFISGGSAMKNLLNISDLERHKIIQSFDSISKKPEFMVIDVGAGAESSSMSFMTSANKVVVVITGEPTSWTDSYALIKAAYLDYKMDNFGIIVNMSHSLQAKLYFDKFQSVVHTCLLLRRQCFVCLIVLWENILNFCQPGSLGPAHAGKCRASRHRNLEFLKTRIYRVTGITVEQRGKLILQLFEKSGRSAALEFFIGLAGSFLFCNRLFEQLESAGSNLLNKGVLRVVKCPRVLPLDCAASSNLLNSGVLRFCRTCRTKILLLDFRQKIIPAFVQKLPEGSLPCALIPRLRERVDLTDNDPIDNTVLGPICVVNEKIPARQEFCGLCGFLFGHCQGCQSRLSVS